jgi:peroxisomal membrane protein 4
MHPLIKSIVFNPHYQPFLALIKGFRNGLVYGAKVRFPHALVMTFLFRDGSYLPYFMTKAVGSRTR